MSDIETILNKCLGCVNKPCQQGCPLHNDTTGFINLMKQKEYRQAYKLLCETTVLSPICGRVCPHSRHCEGSCIGRFKDNAVEIGELEAYVGDLAIKNNWPIPRFTDERYDKRVAIVGGGPAGLTCAAFLVRSGYDVTIFERHSYLGGVISFGIPEFRLEKSVVDATIHKIIELGIHVKDYMKLGTDFTLADLERSYDAIFLAFGKNISLKMGIEGEDKPQVIGGNELLEYKKYPDFRNKDVMVVGGGNVAIDAARTVKRLGANKVIIAYRRSVEEMPADLDEIHEAVNEDIEFLYQTNLVRILGEDRVERVECVKTKLIHRDGEERKHPINIDGSNFEIDIDYVIMAVGSETDKKVIDKLGLNTSSNGTIIINEKYQTSNPKVFAGGDLAIPKGTIAWAARTGRDAADNIINYLESLK